jgi:saccharopine dehydrogenase-like NADP-dependent oxidoreductase
MRIVILGAGRQGRIVAGDLIENGYDVILSDIVDPQIPSTKFIQADLSDVYKRLSIIQQGDIIVCALPARFGYGIVKSCIVAGKDCVDMSYCDENILDLDADAKYKKVKVLPDCGVAPGLSNLVAGRAIHTREPSKVGIQVGGFAKDSNVSLGYAVTWSPEDLLQEFLRPARVIKDSMIEVEEVLSGQEEFEIEGVGRLEAFYTDGLRTMLFNRGQVSVLEEKTIRRAGFMKEVQDLIAEGRFIDYINQNCLNVEDILVMRVVADGREEILVVEAEDGITAMARATAFSCSTFVQVLAEDFVEGYGVIAPEILAQDKDCYTHILDKLAVKNIMFRGRDTINYPFLEVNYP